jgi:hypothetical protein
LEIDLYNEYSGPYDLNNHDVTFFVSWVKINGLLYNSKNMSVIIKVCDENNDMLLLFGFIKSISIVKNEPFIIYVLYKTIFYDEHFGAFKVILTNKLNFIKLKDIENSFPVLHKNINNGNTLIKCK